MNLLVNRVALVTGASRGIGEAIALKFAENGATVAITYYKNRSKAQKVCKKIRQIGSKTKAIGFDYSDPKQAEKLVESIIVEFGRLDILVNNGGILQQKPFEEISLNDYEKVMTTDLRGIFFLSQKAMPHLVKTKGCIINISSVGGQIGGPKAPHYSAAKAGIISLTRSLSNLYAHSGVRTNAIAPGYILTDMTRKIFESPDYKKGVSKAIPLGRAGTPDDVANVALFLASDMASYITGQTINVNGGMYLGQ